jgi:uncharacterized protein
MLALAGVLLGGASWLRADAYTDEIEKWRAHRLSRITAADSWLALVGLHYLKEGANTIGSAKDNDVVIEKLPARLGTVTVAANGKVSLAVAADARDVRVDGKAVRAAELDWNEKTPTQVTCGSITFFALDRNGRKVVRVRDSESERRKHFAGLDYFPIDPKWRIVGRWVPFEKAQIAMVPSSVGPALPTIIPGKAVFEHDGKTYELLGIDEQVGAPLFFVFTDATSGRETYGGMRFLYATANPDGTIVLDFNKAYNPPCVFTSFSTCPLPPKGNALPFPIRAGELKYRGEH